MAHEENSRTLIHAKLLKFAQLNSMTISGLLFIMALLGLVSSAVLHTDNGARVLRNEKNAACARSMQKYQDRIVSAMDLSVDPCEDFYEYACGCWPFQNPIPDGVLALDNFDLTRKKNKIAMKTLLEQPTESLISKAEINAQRYYRSCMDFYSHQKSGESKKDIVEFLDQIGGWPAIEGSNAKVKYGSWNFRKVLLKVHSILKVDAFFDWNLSVHSSTEAMIQISKANLYWTAPDSYIEKNNDNILRDLLNRLKKMGMRLNIHDAWFKIRTIMENVIEVESRIAKTCIDQKDIQISRNLYTIEELQIIAPFLDWNEFFKSEIWNFLQFTPHRLVIVEDEQYFICLSKMIEELLATKEGAEMLRNYLSWRTIHKYLPTGFEDSRGSEEKKNLSCVDDTISGMNLAVSAMFVRQKFYGESKQIAKAVLTAIKKSFKKNLNNLNWLDDVTRQGVKEKIDTLIEHTGFPEFILNPNELDKYYSGYEWKSNNFLINNLEITQLSIRQQLNLKRQFFTQQNSMPVPEFLSVSNYINVDQSIANAFYDRSKNQMILPAGIFQQPFYNATFPSAFNFGALGFLMAHEVTHGFDLTSRMIDHRGNLFHWWNAETLERLEERGTCFLDQYANYRINGQQLDGLGTINENIADNGGLRAAFFAFNNWTVNSPTSHADKIDQHQEFRFLPELNMTQQQVFFLSFAQTLCSSNTEEYIRRQILHDEHTPNHYRVIGSLSNMPEFSSAFDCPTGSPMNPAKKCEIW